MSSIFDGPQLRPTSCNSEGRARALGKLRGVMPRQTQVKVLVSRVVADPDPGGRLRALSTLRRELDSLETELAAEALRSGMSWREIGHALGVTKQAAHRRHSRQVELLEQAVAVRPRGAGLPVDVSARRAIRIARQEAARTGASEVGTEHLLLGVLQCGDRAAADLLGDLGITVGAVRDALEPTSTMTLEAARQAEAQRRDQNTTLVVSPVAQRTLERALAKAAARGAQSLTALDVLDCSLMLKDAGATRTLSGIGVEPADARAAVAQALAPTA